MLMERGTLSASVAHEGYAFGQFVLDLDRGMLLGPQGEIGLRPKSFHVLEYLVEHHGRLVTSQALLEAVWGQTVVTQDSLTQCIVEIRRVLGDDGRHLVRTIPRRGYMLDAPVTRLAATDGTAPVATASAPGGQVGESAPATDAPRRARLMLVLVAAVLVAGLVWLVQREAPVGGGTGVAVPVLPNSVAVLPFVDMSAEQDQEYFGDGIAEEILNLLAQVPALKVIARTSSFSFKGRPVDIAEIAARLGVAHVLEGSVRRSGDRVRITAQLIGTHDSTHLWSESYDRELGDLIDVQTEIAAAVASVLEQELLAARAPERGRPRDPAAYDYFLRARFLFNRRDPGDLDSAREQFEAALRLDPEYAPAWAGLAGVYNVQIVRREGNSSEAGLVASSRIGGARPGARSQRCPRRTCAYCRST
jgi:TolB-like protein/DNA-binding winged helix-turn-helix (wHTH) protein